MPPNVTTIRYRLTGIGLEYRSGTTNSGLNIKQYQTLKVCHTYIIVTERQRGMVVTHITVMARQHGTVATHIIVMEQQHGMVVTHTTIMARTQVQKELKLNLARTSVCTSVSPA